LAQGKSDPVVDILCFLPKNREQWVAAGCLKYVLPIEKAKQKVMALLERLARGEIDSFSVSLSEFGLPKGWAETKQK
jgi:hypothetical protein